MSEAIIEAAARILSAFLSKSDAEWKDYVDEARIILDLCPAITPLIRSAVLEQAAKAAETRDLGDNSPQDVLAQEIAAAIRALKTVDKSDQRS
jgi:Glycyl-tRNA synthetase (class II)